MSRWFLIMSSALCLLAGVPQLANASAAPILLAENDDDDDDDLDDDDDYDRGGDDDDDDDRRPVPRQVRGDDDDDDDDDDYDDAVDPEYGPYVDERGSRPLRADEIVDTRGALARRAEITAMGADAAALRRARRLGFTIVEQTELAGLGTSIVILRAPAGLTVRDALQRLRKSDRRTIYDYNHVYGYRPTTSGGSLVIADGAPQRSPLSTRDDLIIGMIDASISGDHEALRDATLERRDFSEGQLGSDHGLAVGSLLVAETGGLLPNAKLYAASVFFKSQSGDTVGATVALVRALDWMVAKRVAVINMSLAGPDNAVLKTAVARAVEAGHVIVAAVGNDGPAAKPLYPASYDGVVGVTAIDASERVYRRAGRGEQVDFAAPGVDIHAAARDGYARHTGTSFAAPHLAALIATELQAPDAVVREALLQRVLESAKDLGKPGRDTVYGHGLPAMGPR